jgi:hypothetical protein
MVMTKTFGVTLVVLTLPVWLPFWLTYHFRQLISFTKSGQFGAKDAFSSSFRAFHRSVLIQEASGDRVASLGSVNPALESKPFPCTIKFRPNTKLYSQIKVAVSSI